MTNIHQLSGSDPQKFKDLIGLFTEVFETEHIIKPSDTQLQNLLGNDDFIVFVAEENGEIIGGLTAYVLHQYYSPKPLAYLYDLAVKNSFRRRGIGRKLIDALEAFCEKHGFEEMFVQAHEDDEHAIDFYRSFEVLHEEKVRHFSWSVVSGKNDHVI